MGVQGQWLKVRDASNKEGYVAAWYVKYASGSSAQQVTATTTAASNNGGPLKVRATAEGIALRNQPVISDATLIKRLPLGTEFTVPEPNAASKDRQNDQWLKVKDPNWHRRLCGCLVRCTLISKISDIWRKPFMETETPKPAPILEIAWQRHANLDFAADRRTQHFRIRKWITGLAFGNPVRHPDPTAF